MIQYFFKNDILVYNNYIDNNDKTKKLGAYCLLTKLEDS